MSFVKKGGLAFKPKGRRVGPGAAPAPAADAGASPSPVPPTSTGTASPSSTEPPPHILTPAVDPNSSAPATVNSTKTSVDKPDEGSNPAEQRPTAANLQTPSASASASASSSFSESRIETPTVQTTSEPAISLPPPPSLPVIQNPTPQSSNDARSEFNSRPESHAPAAVLPTQDEQPTPNLPREINPPSASITPSQPLIAPPLPTPQSSRSEEGTVVAQSTVPPPPPRSGPISANPPQDEAPTSQPPASKPAPKKRAPVKRKSTVTEDGTGEDGPLPKKKRQPRKRKTVGQSEGAEDGTGADEVAPKKKRQPRKPSAPKTVEPSEGANTETQKTTRKRRREPTPENAEELTVDHTTMTVGELTKDLGIGKRFRHAEEIEQRAREAREKNKQKRLEREKRRLGLLPPEEEDEDDEASQPGRHNDGNETRGAAMAQLGASMESGGGQSIGYDVVDGQIVVQQASLVVDRHNRDLQNLEEVEENDFTNLVNSKSFSKRVQTPGNWTDEETEKFYRLLGMFGTDFETISRLFPGKNRRAIKLKFNKEERLRPNRVNAAMMVRGQKKVNIDIEEYKATQRKWQDKDKILEEHARLAEEHEREVTRLRDERRAAGLLDDDDDNNTGKNKRTNNNEGNARQNGDEFEVIEEDADQEQQENTNVDVDAQPEGIQA